VSMWATFDGGEKRGEHVVCYKNGAEQIEEEGDRAFDKV